MVVPLVFLVLPLSVLFAEVNLEGGLCRRFRSASRGHRARRRV